MKFKIFAVGFGFILAAASELQAQVTSVLFEEVGNLPGFNGSEISIVGDSALVLNTTGQLRIIDISDPTAPTLQSIVTTAGSQTEESGMVTSGTLVYLPSFTPSPRRGYINIFNIADPANPYAYPSYLTRDRALGAGLYGNALIVGDDDAGITVLNVSNPAAPVQIDTHLKYNQDKVVISGNHAFVNDTNNLLTAYNISTPSNIIERDSISFTYEVERMLTSGSLVLTSHGTQPIDIIDASNPSNLTVRASITPDSYAVGFAFYEGYLLSAQRGAGLIAYDVADLDNIQKFGEYDTDGQATAVAVRGDYIYVADGSNGLLVLRALQVPVELSSISLD